MVDKKKGFEDAINYSLVCCQTWDHGELSDEVLADKVSELFSKTEGIRGFLAVSLSSDSPLMDRLPEILIIKFRSAGEAFVDITVKNLAMSTAMVLHHERLGDIEHQIGSERVRNRCIELLRVLEPNLVKNRLNKLLKGINGEGEDVQFLNHWKYDDAQKKLISSNIYLVAKK